MNGILKSVVDALLAGDRGGAQEHLAIFPPGYAETIVTPDGALTSAGIDAAIGYPLPRELKSGLKNAVEGDGRLPGQLDNAAPQIELFRFADESGRLTETGRCKAIELLPLRRQCEILRLTVEDIDLPKKKSRVERDVLDSLRLRGAEAVGYEGMPFQVLISLCGSKVLQLDRVGFLEASVVQWPEFDRSRPDLLGPLQKAINSASSRKIKKAFGQLQPGSLIESAYPEISERLLCALLESLGGSRASALAEFFLENPYAHRNGWPDITAITNGKVELIEVKTTDKLHFSQIRALPRIASIVPDVKVLVVTRTN